MGVWGGGGGGGGGPTVSQQLGGRQDLGALLGVGDVELVQVRLLQTPKVLQALEAVHGQQRAQLLETQRDVTSPPCHLNHYPFLILVTSPGGMVQIG